MWYWYVFKSVARYNMILVCFQRCGKIQHDQPDWEICWACTFTLIYCSSKAQEKCPLRGTSTRSCKVVRMTWNNLHLAFQKWQKCVRISRPYCLLVFHIFQIFQHQVKNMRVVKLEKWIIALRIPISQTR